MFWVPRGGVTRRVPVVGSEEGMTVFLCRVTQPTTSHGSMWWPVLTLD
jgi:hypothetical protein